MKVQIAFDLAANGVGDFFTLDDTTKGVLDNVNYTLAGEVLVDVTDTVRQVSIKRGRNRQLEKFTAGNASIVLDNRDRAYDPTNAASPYFGSIVPRKEVVISDVGVTLYTGQVADWNYNYSVTGDSTADVNCVDGLTLLVDPVLTAGTATPELPSARINSVLDNVNWPETKRVLSTGNVTLDADVIEADKVKALDYLNKVAVSEPGALFVNTVGDIVFRDRNDLQNAARSVVFGTGGIPFVDIAVEYGVEEMANNVSVTYYGGTAVAGTAVSTDADSITAYGTFDATYDTLLASLDDAQELADWQVGLYSRPQYRVDRITVQLDGLTTTDQQTLLGLELSDLVTVTWTPNNVGDALSQVVSIDSIELSASPASRQISFGLSQTTAAFILDDPLLGVLDASILGFWS